MGGLSLENSIVMRIYTLLKNAMMRDVGVFSICLDSISFRTGSRLHPVTEGICMSRPLLRPRQGGGAG